MFLFDCTNRSLVWFDWFNLRFKINLLVIVWNFRILHLRRWCFRSMCGSLACNRCSPWWIHFSIRIICRRNKAGSSYLIQLLNCFIPPLCRNQWCLIKQNWGLVKIWSCLYTDTDFWRRNVNYDIVFITLDSCLEHLSFLFFLHIFICAVLYRRAKPIIEVNTSLVLHVSIYFI